MLELISYTFSYIWQVTDLKSIDTIKHGDDRLRMECLECSHVTCLY